MCIRVSNGSFISAETLLELNRACLLFVLMLKEEDLEERYAAEARL